MSEVVLAERQLVICMSAVSNPIPSNLKSEAKKAARILQDFTEISNRNGPDKLIPGEENDRISESAICRAGWDSGLSFPSGAS